MRRHQVDPEAVISKLTGRRKHFQWHTKPWHCDRPNCQRGVQGFATAADLERHRGSVHKMLPRSGVQEYFVCVACPREINPKEWPRKDNFKAHIKRKHPGENVEELTEMLVGTVATAPTATTDGVIGRVGIGTP